MKTLFPRILPALRRITALAAAAALMAGVSGKADAAPVKYAAVRNWEIYSNGYYCTASGKYGNDTLLQFNFGTNGFANIAIWNFRWKIPKGTYQVVVSVDRAPSETFQAEADGYYVMMPWQMDRDQVNLVSNGVVFRATVGKELLEFNLAGSREMLRSLVGCVLEISPSAANPFAGEEPATKASPPSNPFAETPSNPYRKL